MEENRELLTPEEVTDAIQRKAYNFLRRRFQNLEPVDVAEAIAEQSPDVCATLFRLITSDAKPEVFSYLPFELQKALLEIFPDDAVTVLLNEMEPVDRTQLLEELPIEISSKYILRLDPDERTMAWRLLSYPEDSVGRIMSPEVFAIKAGQSVGRAIEYVRWNASRYPEEALGQIFIVDEEGRYLGDTSLGALFVADDTNEKVETLAGPAYVALSAYDDDTVAVEVFRKYDRHAIAVVDDNNRLLGVVSSDDVFDIAEEEATEDIQQFGGAGALEDSYFQTPLSVLIRKRAGWLSLLFLGGLWAGRALKGFEDEIATYAFLVFFLPLIISSGGNSGSQAASLIIRGIAVREFNLSDWHKVLLRELMAGLGLGLILGVMGFVCALFWGLGPLVGLIVFCSLVGVVIFGAVCGGMLPFLLKRIGLDPAVSSSPLIASLVDLFGIIIFFNIALYFMKIFTL